MSRFSLSFALLFSGWDVDVKPCSLVRRSRSSELCRVGSNYRWTQIVRPQRAHFYFYFLLTSTPSPFPSARTLPSNRRYTATLMLTYSTEQVQKQNENWHGVKVLRGRYESVSALHPTFVPRRIKSEFPPGFFSSISFYSNDRNWVRIFRGRSCHTRLRADNPHPSTHVGL